MNETLHSIGEPVIPANEGWQQMHALLNVYLPVKKKAFFGKRFLLPVFTTVMTAACLLIAFQLNDTVVFHRPHNKTAGLLPVYQKNTGIVNFFIKNAKPVLRSKKFTGPAGLSPIHANDLSFSAEMPTLLSAKMPAVGLTISIVEKQVGAHIAWNKNIVRLAVNQPDKNDRKSIPARQSSWTLFAGLGVNGTFSNDQNLQPYPVAEARYNLNQHIYLAVGLTAWSPVSAGAAGINKTFYLNDNTNGMMLYNETNRYDHLKYADIPLLAGININKNIALQGGIQASVLLGKKTTKSVTGPIASPVAVTARDTPQDYHTGVRPIDYRFIAGLRYTVNKAVIGLTYQHGLQTIGSGNYADPSRNHLVSLGLLFKLK